MFGDYTLKVLHHFHNESFNQFRHQPESMAYQSKRDSISYRSESRSLRRLSTVWRRRKGRLRIQDLRKGLFRRPLGLRVQARQWKLRVQSQRWKGLWAWRWACLEDKRPLRLLWKDLWRWVRLDRRKVRARKLEKWKIENVVSCSFG